MDYIYFALALIVLISIVLYFILSPGFRERKITNGVRNQDAFSQNYLFKVNYQKQEFIRLMNLPNVSDALEYIFDDTKMVVTFSKHGANIPYTVFIKECNSGCYVKLIKNVLIGNRSNIPYQINEFMIKKFGAELLPYEEYKNIIT